jgi:hypothetical protein
MKYKLSFLIVLMLVDLSCSPERSGQPNQQHRIDDGSTLSLGMRHELALEIIRECGGQDITAKLAVVGPNGEWPLSSLYWSLEEYDSVVEIVAENGNVIGISYWRVADFSESKIHRFESRRDLKSLTFEKQTKTLSMRML